MQFLLAFIIFITLCLVKDFELGMQRTCSIVYKYNAHNPRHSPVSLGVELGMLTARVCVVSLMHPLECIAPIPLFIRTMRMSETEY